MHRVFLKTARTFYNSLSEELTLIYVIVILQGRNPTQKLLKPNMFEKIQFQIVFKILKLTELQFKNRFFLAVYFLIWTFERPLAKFTSSPSFVILNIF